MAKVCKKCGKELPNDYNDDLCGYCKKQGIDNLKKAGKIAAGVLGAIGVAVRVLILKK